MTTPQSRDKVASKSSLRAASRADLIEITPANIEDPQNVKLKSPSVSSKPGTTGTPAGSGERPSNSSTERLNTSHTVIEAAAQTPSKSLEKSFGSEAFSAPNPNLEIPAEGILPLFLTTMTQELFHVKTNEEVTAEKPIKIIPKADLLSDIQARLAISDFQPAKAYILDYPAEELVLYFDATYKYGQNFFLCISPETANAILQPPVTVAVEEQQKPKRPVPKIYLKISQKLKDFGAPFKFSDKDAADACIELRSFKDPAFETNRMELAIGIQAVPDLKDSEAQTSWFRPLNFSSQYEPRFYPPEIQQQIMRSDEMADFVSSVMEKFEKALQQNCIMNIFSDDYLVLGEEDIALEQGSHTTLQPNDHKLILEAPDDVLCFKFNPSDPNIIAGGCVNGEILIWDITEYQDKLKSNKKPKSADSRSNGQPGSNDINGRGDRNTESSIPVVKSIASSSIEFSHRMPITDMQWLLRSLELSHSACYWDTRSKKDLRSLDLLWKPFLRVPLSAMDNTFDYGLARISIKPPMAEKNSSELNLNEKSDKNAQKYSSKFYSATEEGDLIYSDWIQEKSNEEKASRVESALSCHFGPMSDLERSPFFPDILLSVGGWSFHIWKEKITSGPLLSSGPSMSYLVSGRWSPTRPGVFFISKSNGQIEVWDLLDRSHLPSTFQNVSSIAVSYMAIHQYPGKAGYQFIAAGDDEGTLHILEVPRNLSKPNKNEQSFVRAFFEREVKRIAYVHERKQFRIKERGKWEQANVEAAAAQKNAAGANAEKKEDSSSTGNTTANTVPAAGPAVTGLPSQDDMEKLEQEYLKMERRLSLEDRLQKWDVYDEKLSEEA
ncbi:WD repeat-containing protein 63 [Dinochytrium kinnereticum]|nr:WD repeat-containing protein 63 [Dinochytrium kinnereticum]